MNRSDELKIGVMAAAVLGYLTAIFITLVDSFLLAALAGILLGVSVGLIGNFLVGRLRLNEYRSYALKAWRESLASWTLSNLHRPEDVKAKMLNILNGEDAGEPKDEEKEAA